MTGASEELCYFCREHEMRPLRTGKQGEKGGGDIQGAFRLLALTRGKSLETTPRLVFSGGVARWFQMHAHSPGSRLQLCPRHLSSGRKTMRWEGRGHETGDWEGGGGGDRGRDLLKHWDRKRDLWISSFSSLQLLVSPSHVMCNSRKDRSAFVSRNGGGFSLSPRYLSGSSSLTQEWERETTLTHSDLSVICQQVHQNHSIVRPTLTTMRSHRLACDSVRNFVVDFCWTVRTDK